MYRRSSFATLPTIPFALLLFFSTVSGDFQPRLVFVDLFNSSRSLNRPACAHDTAKSSLSCTHISLRAMTGRWKADEAGVMLFRPAENVSPLESQLSRCSMSQELFCKYSIPVLGITAYTIKQSNQINNRFHRYLEMQSLTPGVTLQARFLETVLSIIVLATHLLYTTTHSTQAQNQHFADTRRIGPTS